ncbi:hypothetical protein E2320_013720, partial [Naja naja]
MSLRDPPLHGSQRKGPTHAQFMPNSLVRSAAESPGAGRSVGHGFGVFRHGKKHVGFGVDELFAGNQEDASVKLFPATLRPGGKLGGSPLLELKGRRGGRRAADSRPDAEGLAGRAGVGVWGALHPH